MLCAHMFINNSQSPIKSQPPNANIWNNLLPLSFRTNQELNPDNAAKFSIFLVGLHDQMSRVKKGWFLPSHLSWHTFSFPYTSQIRFPAAQVSYPTVCQVSDLKLPYWPISPWSQTATSTGQGILKQFGKSPCSSTSNSCSTFEPFENIFYGHQPQTPNPKPPEPINPNPNDKTNSQKNHTNQKKKKNHLHTWVAKLNSHSSKKFTSHF